MKKKILAAVMSVLMVFTAVSLTGCGSDTAESSDDTAAAKYTVGICQLVQHDALDAATDGFKAALTDKLGTDVKFVEQNASNDSATCVTICNQFVASKVDLIMANATPALQAAAAATGSIPIVGTSVTDYATALDIDNWNGTTGKNITGTSDLAPLDQQAAMLAELYPAASNPKVGILYCSGEANSLYQVNVITPYLEDLGYTVKAYAFADSNDVANVTQTACSESDVLYIPTDNTAASCTEAINNVALPSKTPIIAGEEGICKGCGVATLSISYYDIGYKAGLIAYDILVNGKDISTYEVGFADTVTKKYNADIVSQLGLEIPDDYEAIATE
ncbi:MAG: ABC transporter substrate-binding protein [Acutalibacteraceae bacterium]